MAAPEKFDFAIFGSGFGGSITAMVLRRLGRSVLLLERGAHPRFAIGESSTPFANLLLERLAAEYDLPFLRNLAEWGTWQAEFPQLACGLKRGFTFFHHSAGHLIDFRNRDTQLLVAASPNDRVGDTHWYRPEFDQYLVRQAQRLGVTYLDHSQIEKCEQNSEWHFRINRLGARREFCASFAIDASGASGVLGDQLKIDATGFARFPKTHAIFAHFKNAPPIAAASDFGSVPPYPPDDAAVHHLFEGGWAWVLRFNNGITSAGAALRSDLFARGESPEKLWRELIPRFPSLARQFATAEIVAPFYAASQLSFRRTRAAGTNWALLPSAAGFVDPLLSTGFALTLLGIMRLAKAFARDAPELTAYQLATFRELDAAAELIGALYAKMNSFPEFASLSLLYFAALSYTETAWRLGKEELASSFLLANNPEFTAVRKRFCADAQAGRSISASDLGSALSPWNIAGLADPTRRNWYPVSWHDLESSSHKLGASRAEVQRLIEKLR